MGNGSAVPEDGTGTFVLIMKLPRASCKANIMGEFSLSINGVMRVFSETDKRTAGSNCAEVEDDEDEEEEDEEDDENANGEVDESDGDDDERLPDLD